MYKVIKRTSKKDLFGAARVGFDRIAARARTEYAARSRRRAGELGSGADAFVPLFDAFGLFDASQAR